MKTSFLKINVFISFIAFSSKCKYIFFILQKATNRSSMMFKYKELQENAKQTKKVLDKLPPDSNKDFVQFTTVDAEFLMLGMVFTCYS